MPAIELTTGPLPDGLKALFPESPIALGRLFRFSPCRLTRASNALSSNVFKNDVYEKHGGQWQIRIPLRIAGYQVIHSSF